jgi:hypothetical protein
MQRWGPSLYQQCSALKKKPKAVAFRQHTQLPLDDCLYALQATIPKLTRSALHRLFQRHGISRLPLATDRKSPEKKKFKQYPIGYLHVDFAEVRTEDTAQLNDHLQAFLLAYNHARRLKTLGGLTPHQFICAQHQNNPAIFKQNPTQLVLRLYN